VIKVSCFPILIARRLGGEVIQEQLDANDACVANEIIGKTFMTGQPGPKLLHPP
jgi:hypothetical protein